LIKGKDITLKFLYDKYLPETIRSIKSIIDLSDEETEDTARDVLLDIFEGIEDDRMFRDNRALHYYVLKCFRNKAVDLLRKKTGMRDNKFNITEGEILNWPGLRDLLSDNANEKISWTNKFLTMIDDDHTLFKDLADAI